MAQRNADEVSTSSLTVAELRYGADKSSRPAQDQGSLDTFLSPLGICGFDAEAAAAYGSIRVTLEQRGTLIAAHALSLNATLVTDATREFGRVPGLKLEDWTNA